VETGFPKRSCSNETGSLQIDCKSTLIRAKTNVKCERRGDRRDTGSGTIIGIVTLNPGTLYHRVSADRMQKEAESKEYRRKAAECARKALACREPAIRRGFAEAARRWRKKGKLAPPRPYGSLPFDGEQIAAAACRTIPAPTLSLCRDAIRVARRHEIAQLRRHVVHEQPH
jgi:hypothetical protein